MPVPGGPERDVRHREGEPPAPRHFRPRPAPKVDPVVPLELWTCGKCRTRVPFGYACNCGRKQLNEG